MAEAPAKMVEAPAPSRPPEEAEAMEGRPGVPADPPAKTALPFLTSKIAWLVTKSVERAVLVWTVIFLPALLVTGPLMVAAPLPSVIEPLLVRPPVRSTPYPEIWPALVRG